MYITGNHRWTGKEVQFIKDHYQTKTASWIAKELGLCPKRVSSYAANILKLRKKSATI